MASKCVHNSSIWWSIVGIETHNPDSTVVRSVQRIHSCQVRTVKTNHDFCKVYGKIGDESRKWGSLCRSSLLHSTNMLLLLMIFKIVGESVHPVTANSPLIFLHPNSVWIELNLGIYNIWILYEFKWKSFQRVHHTIPPLPPQPWDFLVF